MKMICIMCPLGCEMEVNKLGNDYKVTGNSCLRGKDYAIAELTAPTRILTSLIRTSNGVLPVKTTKPIPKKLIPQIIDEIGKVNIKKGKIGDIVIVNVLGTGANIVITGNSL